MADRTVRVRLEAIIGPYQRAMAEVAASTRAVTGDMARLGRVTQGQAEQFASLGRAGVLAGGAMLAGMGVAVKAAIDFESAFAGVAKTVEGTDAQLSTLRDGIRELSKEVPASTSEIASVAEAAGALGVETESVLSFTRVMIDLGETTNLTADQAATAFARIANVMGTAQSDFDRMGATVVELGNNGASTEAEITELANRLAAAGRIAGLSEADVFAFAETLASVGVEAEAGGTALSKVFTSIRDAVLDGSDKLEVFAQVAGMSTDAFSSAFRDDPAAAIASFVEGLGGISEAGQSTTAVFEALELTDQRLMRALLSTGAAGDYLRGQIVLANKAWEDNNALSDEAAKRYETTAAQLEILKNQIVDVAISFGAEMLPAVRAIAEVLEFFVQGFRDLVDALGPAGPLLAGIAGTASLLAGAFLLLLPRIVATQAAMATMATTAPALAAGLRGLMIAAGGIGAVLTIASVAMAIFGSDNEQATRYVDDFTEALRQQTEGVEDAVRALIIKKLVDQDLDTSARRLGLSLATVAAAIEGDADALARFKQATSAVADDDAVLLPRGEELKKLRDEVLGMAGDLDTARDKQSRTTDAQHELGVETTATADAFDAAGASVDDFGKKLDDLYNKTFGAQEATDQFTSDLADFADQVMAAKEAGDANATSLSDATTQGLRNREMLRGLTQSALDVADALEAAGASPQEIAAAMGQYRGAILDVLGDLGFSADKANEFVDILLNIDGIAVSPEVYVDTDKAKKDLDDLILRLSAIQTGGDALGAIAADIIANAPTGTSPASNSAVRGAVGGQGPAATSAREQRTSSERSAVEDYLRALHEQEEEAKRAAEAVAAYLRAHYEHRMELEDNMYRFDAMSKDRYLELLHERLAGLEEYSAEWARVMDQIREVRGEALELELATIRAYEEGRLFQQAWDQLAGQRSLYPVSGNSSSIVTTKNWSPTFIANGSDAMQATETNNQKLRDLAVAGAL